MERRFATWLEGLGLDWDPGLGLRTATEMSARRLEGVPPLQLLPSHRTALEMFPLPTHAQPGTHVRTPPLGLPSWHGATTIENPGQE